jgi:hypothetical protein
MNYECHITVDVKDAARATHYANWCNHPSIPLGGVWKTSEIARDPLLGDRNFFYLTAHDSDIIRMTRRMTYAVAWLEGNGVHVLREKIELIMHDKRYPMGASQ